MDVADEPSPFGFKLILFLLKRNCGLRGASLAIHQSRFGHSRQSRPLDAVDDVYNYCLLEWVDLKNILQTEKYILDNKT